MSEIKIIELQIGSNTQEDLTFLNICMTKEELINLIIRLRFLKLGIFFNINEKKDFFRLKCSLQQYEDIKDYLF